MPRQRVKLRGSARRRAVQRQADAEVEPGPIHPALALQRTAGNAAVAHALSGKMDGGAPEDVPITGARPRLEKATVADGGGGPVATGTGFSTVHPAKGMKNGSFSWTIQWVLDTPSPKGGWIVQGVSASIDVKDAKGKDADISGSGVDRSWWPMWEAWPVHKGQKVTTYAEGGDKEDDTYGMRAMGDHTKGEIKINGKAEFYEGLTLPSAFKATNKAPAWILPTTKTSPTLAGGTGSVDHSITATWDSTPPSTDDKTKVTPS